LRITPGAGEKVGKWVNGRVASSSLSSSIVGALEFSRLGSGSGVPIPYLGNTIVLVWLDIELLRCGLAKTTLYGTLELCKGGNLSMEGEEGSEIMGSWGY